MFCCLHWSICLAGIKTTTPYTSSTTTPSTPSFSDQYFYMDDTNKCDQTHTTYFSTQSQDAFVESWGHTNPHKPPTNGCKAKYSSYSNYGLKYRFTVGDYINDCGVTINIYSNLDGYGVPMVSYKYILLSDKRF